MSKTSYLKFMFKKYKHFYAKDESTHPSMVSTHQHRFKGKMCKKVETVSTHVKSVSTRVAVFQKSSLPRSTHSQSRSTHSQSRLTLDPVPRTAKPSTAHLGNNKTDDGDSKRREKYEKEETASVKRISGIPLGL
ncbi:hypothetical protein Taro_018861 [Colocasia esculenta]|uniref:Uncharacterized protein n=1 Tax=Colocasia esculenta TaxID=4460 RepID=A0A843UXI8_COLES|nr:hypothetical protein [Colocasia esculenta]